MIVEKDRIEKEESGERREEKSGSLVQDGDIWECRMCGPQINLNLGHVAVWSYMTNSI